jgi:uncharacterized LabA/DUF88 family protein
MPERCILYVDGFNFYYAIKRQSSTVPIHLGWCDFGQLAQRLIEPGATVRAVKYFTAPVAELGEPGGVAGSESARQSICLDAVRTVPGIVVVEGFHRRGDDSSTPHAPRKKREEKQTDVDIAVSMLVDAAKDACDRLRLITADQDQIPAVTAVRREFGKRVDVWLPPTDGNRIPTSWQAVAANDGVRVRVITAETLSASRLPDRIEAHGRLIKAPAIWRAPNRR